MLLPSSCVHPTFNCWNAILLATESELFWHKIEQGMQNDHLHDLALCLSHLDGRECTVRESAEIIQGQRVTPFEWIGKS